MWGKKNRLFASAVALIAFGAVIVAELVHGTDSGMLRRGDFPAFYTAAVAVQQIQSAQIYEPEVQRQLQNRYFPDMKGRYLAFAYPPYFALALEPLALLSPSEAKLAYLGVQALFAALGFLLLIFAIPRLKAEVLPSAALFVTFAPLMTAVLGAQNSALSLLLMVSSSLLLAKRKCFTDAAAGVLLALWLFKPQLPMLFVLALILRPRKLAALAAFAGTAAFICTLAIYRLGSDSFVAWIRAAYWFSNIDRQMNGHLMISLPDFAVVIGQGRAQWLLTGAGSAAALALAGLALKRFYHAALSSDAGLEFQELLFLGATAALCGPHTMYYELTLLLPVAFLVFTPHSDREVWRLVVCQLVILVLCAVKDSLVVQPLAPLALIALFFLRRRCDERSKNEQIGSVRPALV